MLKLSASSVGTYESCPKKYHYNYIVKPDIEKPEWDHLEFGSCAHRILELFHLKLLDDPVPSSEYHLLMKECFKGGLSEFKMRLLKPNLPYLKEVIQDYLNTIYDFGVPDVVGVETEFTIDIDGYKVRGFIDRVDRLSPGEYRVVDYKTSKNPKYLKDFQLLVYALAIKELFPDAETIHGSYCLLKHKCSTKDYSFTEFDYEKCRKKIKQVGDYISSDTVWIKKPSKLCDWCDYKSICLPEGTGSNEDTSWV
jgi:putative RecB family exonuclease